MIRPMRLLLLTVVLGAGLAAAQEGPDSCNSKCSETMSQCMGKCAGNMKCANPCQTRMMDCMKRCQEQPQKGASTAGKGKKCYGADGSKMPCGDFKAVKPNTKVKPEDDDEAQYPNNSAKDLAKDPNFKGAAPAE